MVSDHDTSHQYLASFKRALVICPHTDDELGCAGAILRLAHLNVKTKLIALSRCEQSVPTGYPTDILERECKECCARLGIGKDDVEVWDFEVRRFSYSRQEILERFVTLNRSYSPDLILIPAIVDTHQDHHVVSQEGFRAFKFSTILGYELPQNLISFRNSCFIRLDETIMERKVYSLSAYESQQFRPYASSEFIYSLAKVRGVQCKAPFAEAFEAIRIIL